MICFIIKENITYKILEKKPTGGALCREISKLGMHEWGISKCIIYIIVHMWFMNRAENASCMWRCHTDVIMLAVCLIQKAWIWFTCMQLSFSLFMVIFTLDLSPKHVHFRWFILPQGKDRRRFSRKMKDQWR